MGISHGKVMAVEYGGNDESTIFASDVERYDNNEPYVAGNTADGTGRKQGNSYWRGHYFSYARDSADNRQPLVFPNDSGTLLMSFDAGTKGMTGTARFNKLTIDWPIEQGGYIFHRVDFLCNGALTIAATASAEDATVPCPMSAKIAVPLKVAGATIANVNYMQLMFTADCAPYCNSSSAGQWMHDAGFLDIRAMWRVDDDDPNNWPTIGAFHTINMYVTTAKYWALEWMRIKGVMPIHQDTREGKRVTGYTAIAEMNASSCTALGSVINPKGTTVWNA